MKFHRKLALAAATMALAATPTLALASGNPHGGTHGQSATAPGHTGSHHNSSKKPNDAEKYGKYCQGESKRHVRGIKGTPFSQCVTAMAHLAQHKVATPAAACAGLSKKHVAGSRGTPYSVCVSGAERLLKAARS